MSGRGRSGLFEARLRNRSRTGRRSLVFSVVKQQQPLCGRRVSLCSKLVRRIVVLSPVESEAVVGSLSWLVLVWLLRLHRRSTAPSSRGGALAVVMVPTSPGWGPVFGARRAAAAVLAAPGAVDLAVPFSLRLDSVQWS